MGSGGCVEGYEVVWWVWGDGGIVLLLFLVVLVVQEVQQGDGGEELGHGGDPGHSAWGEGWGGGVDAGAA